MFSFFEALPVFVVGAVGFSSYRCPCLLAAFVLLNLPFSVFVSLFLSRPVSCTSMALSLFKSSLPHLFSLSSLP